MATSAMFAAVRFVRDHCPAGVDSTAHHVAMIIAASVGRGGVAEIGARRLAELARLHPETVSLAVARLEAAGVVAVDRPGAGRRSRYRFPVATSVEVVPNRTDRPHTQVFPNRADRAPKARGEAARVGVCEHVENAHAGARPNSLFLPGTGWVSQPESEAV